MPKIDSQFKLSSELRSVHRKHHEKLQSELREITKKVLEGGGEKALKRHHERGKLSARERIDILIDYGAPFLELSTLAAYDVYETDVPSAGMVSGIGKVKGHLCMIVANDATVKGGTYFPLSVKKHLRAQEIALKNHLPCIYLVDSGGAFLPLQSEVFPDRDHFGRIFFNQAQMSSLGIPQLAVVLGSCTAGGAYIPAMADESIIVRNNGTIFLGGPPLVKAATGEEIEANELGGAEVHTQISGVADHLAESEEEALDIVRSILEHIPSSASSFSSHDVLEPLYQAEEILEILPEDTTKEPFEVREIICRIIDGSDFQEFKKNYGETLVCGFARIYGMEVGILANNGILFSESSVKGAHFIQLCSQRKIPLVFLQNITGFMIGSEAEHGGIAKHGAKMVLAVSNANVPKITVVIGGSYGAGNYGMCGRAYDPNFLFMWPNAKIAVMGGEQAANVLAGVKTKNQTPKEIEELKQQVHEKFEKQSHAFYSTAHLWDDGIIEPYQTRYVLGLCLAACIQREYDKTQYGVWRM